MSRTATATNQRQQTAPLPQAEQRVTQMADRVVEYVPLGAAESIKLSCNIIQLVLNPKTKNGHKPPEDQLLKFIMLCKARRLDPFEGDAYLLGYEGQDGDNWSLITSIYAFLKRAEVSENYDGIESGVIVMTKDGIVDRVGDMYLKEDFILGGWAKVHRKDRKFPNVKRVSLATYSTGRSRWKDDPGGQIVKVAEMQALRDTFPTTLGGMYVPEEMEKVTWIQAQASEPPPQTLADKIKNKNGSTPKAAEPTPEPAKPSPQADPPLQAGEIPNDATDPPGDDAKPAELTDEEKAAIEAEDAKAATPADPLAAKRQAVIAELERTGRTWDANYKKLCGKLPLEQVSEAQLSYALADMKPRPNKAE